jgi:hypothetical protein
MYLIFCKTASKTFASIRRTLDEASQLFTIHVFQKKTGTDSPA